MSPDRRHVPVWYGDRWECLCGWASDDPGEARAHADLTSLIPAGVGVEVWR